MKTQRIAEFVKLYYDNYELFVQDYKSNLEPKLLIFSRKEGIPFVESNNPKLRLLDNPLEAEIEDDFGNRYIFGLDALLYSKYDVDFICKVFDKLEEMKDK